MEAAALSLSCARLCDKSSCDADDEPLAPPAVHADELPGACLLAVFAALTVRDRARAACVCAAWREALRSTAAWEDGDFGAVGGASITPAALEAVAQRAAGRMTALRLPDGCAALRPTAILALARANPHLRHVRALGLRLPWSGMLIADVLALAPSLTCLEADACLVEGMPPGEPGAEDGALLDPLTAGGALLAALASGRFACRWLHVAGRLRRHGLAALAAALRSGALVRALHLAFAELDDASAAILAGGVRGAPVLRDLNLRANAIGGAGAVALAAALSAPPADGGLRRLCLGSNVIGLGGASAMGAALAHRSCVLTHLDLSGNGIDADGAAALACGLRFSGTLVDLALGFNRIGPSGAGALADALLGAPALTSLELEWNGVGSSGAAALARALALRSAARGLQHLGLSSNAITAVGAAALGDALAAGAALGTLALSNNARLGNDGAAALARGLCSARATLRRLELGACSVGTAGARALARSLECAGARLHGLDLSQNAVGADGVAALTRGLRANVALAELSLSVRVPAGTAEVTLLRTPGAPPGPWTGHANARVLP